MSIITINAAPRDKSRGLLKTADRTFPCALGRNGQSLFKQEGDGATPILTTRPLYGFYRSDRQAKPTTSLSFRPLQPSMGWCDDIHHPSYNRLVTCPFSASHEKMWRDDSLYDLVIVLDINVTQRTVGRGSALFMHVTRHGYTPTEGCIALCKKDLHMVLRHLSPDTHIHIHR